jgi:alkaline phosphatase D
VSGAEITRREVAIGVAAAAFAPMALAQDAPLTRIAFGACSHEDKDQPIWDAILEKKPQLFIHLGDAVYGDTRSPDELRAKYAKFANKPEFRRFREAVPILSIWDDHDYGENDSGAAYPMKEESRAIFCDFWGIPAASPRRQGQPGVFTAETFGPEGQRVRIILPDLRWNRSRVVSVSKNWGRYAAWALQRRLRGQPIPGPYRPNTEDGASMLGAQQWDWLEAELAKPAAVRILGSSIGILCQGSGWETWENYPADHARLLAALKPHRGTGLALISGDVHYGEISKLEDGDGPALIEAVSSGLTQVMPILPPNTRRVGKAFRGRNFGLLEIAWNAEGPRVTAVICDESGAPQITQPF